MTLQEHFKKETNQDAYYLDQTQWNDYYIEWLETKNEQLKLNSSSLQMTIKNWYVSVFTTDELREEINPNATFEELKNNLPNVYDYLGIDDSIVRERVFSELAKRMNVDYDVIHYKWLKG